MILSPFNHSPGDGNIQTLGAVSAGHPRVPLHLPSSSMQRSFTNCPHLTPPLTWKGQRQTPVGSGPTLTLKVEGRETIKTRLLLHDSLTNLLGDMMTRLTRFMTEGVRVGKKEGRGKGV